MHYLNKQGDVTNTKETLATKIAQRKRILWRDLLIVLVLAVSLRTVCSFRSFGDAENRQIGDDAVAYRTLADNLVDGQGFGRIKPVGPEGEDVWTPEFCWTPGYPSLIAGFEWLTGHGQAPTIVFQQVLGIVLCLMVMVICQRHFGRKAGLVAGCLLALDFQAIGLSNILIADCVFGFLLCCSVFLAAKFMDGGSIWFSLEAGLLLGIGILTKPAGMPLPTVLFTVILIYAYIKRRTRLIPAALIVCVAAYLPVFGWSIRNSIVCGEYAFCSQPKHFLLQITTVLLARSEGISREVALERILAKTGVSYRQVRYLGLSPEENRKVREAAISTIIENRSSLMKEWVVSSAKLLFSPEKLTLLALGLPHIAFGIQGDSTDISNVSAVSAAILAWETLVLGSTYVMLFITLWKCIRLRRLPTLVLICLISALCILVLSSMPGGGDPRYRSQIIPLLVVIAAASFGLNRQTGFSHSSEVELLS
jgi:4-amino-4-deoxy-L-arabinose transferase-like glycosyltransferase